MKQLIRGAGIDRRFLDPLPMFMVPFKAVGTEWGLPPIRRLFHHWIPQARPYAGT